MLLLCNIQSIPPVNWLISSRKSESLCELAKYLVPRNNDPVMLPNSDRKLQLSVWILETETRAVHTVCLEIMVGLVLQSEQSSTIGRWLDRHH